MGHSQSVSACSQQTELTSVNKNARVRRREKNQPFSNDFLADLKDKKLRSAFSRCNVIVDEIQENLDKLSPVDNLKNSDRIRGAIKEAEKNIAWLDRNGRNLSREVIRDKAETLCESLEKIANILSNLDRADFTELA